MLFTRSIKDYIERLSSDQPTPGGGGTSGLVGALAISLIIMVARITLNRKDVPAEKLKKAIDHLLRLRKRAEAVIDEDPKVYQEVINCFKQLKLVTNKKPVEANVEAALSKSFRVQADLCQELITAKKLLVEVGRVATKAIRNDLIVANGFLEGAFKGAEATARINAVYMEQGKKKRHCEHELNKAIEEFEGIKF